MFCRSPLSTLFPYTTLFRSVRTHECGQPKPSRKLDQHVLKRLAFTFRRHDGHAHRVCRPVEFGDRAVEHRHRVRSEEHTSELQSPCNLVCRLLLEKKK